MPIQKIKRKIVQPPGNLGKYKQISYEDSLGRIHESANLSEGAKNLFDGLLSEGGVVKFGMIIGLGYEYEYKHFFDTPKATAALIELADQIRGKVDAVISPEDSAIILLGILGFLLQVPIIRVNKDDSQQNGSFVVGVESYTSGKLDRLSIKKEALRKAQKIGGRLFFVDEIIDCGAMTIAVSSLIKQARNEDIDVRLVGAGALMEKMFTEARKNVKDAGLDFKPISVLKIEDLGLSPNQWIKVQGVNEALTFKNIR